MTTMTEAGGRGGRDADVRAFPWIPGMSGTPLWWTMRMLVLAALALSAYLLWSSLSGAAVAGCDENAQRCASVLSSRWRSWLGIPVSALGAMLYLVMLVALFFSHAGASARNRLLSWSILLPAAVMAGGAAIWFMGLQAVAIRAFCPFCMAAHACALAAAVMILAVSRSWNVFMPGYSGARPLLLAGGGVGLGLLIAGQILMPGATALVVNDDDQGVYDTGPGPERVIRLAKTSITISPHAVPILGSPDADRIAVVFFAYDCMICRKEYQHFKHAAIRYGSRLGVVWLPLGCRPDDSAHDHGDNHEGCDHSELNSERCVYTMLAAAIWRHAPEHFPRFHDWLMTDAPPMLRNGPIGTPSVEHSRAYAASLIGVDALEDTLADPVLKEITLRWREWRLALPDHNGGVPVISAGSNLIYGELLIARELFEILESSLNVAPLDAAKGAEASAGATLTGS